MKNLLSARGLSLLEIMVSALILAFIVIGLTEVLNIGALTFPIDSAWLDLQQQTRQAMEWMTKDLRETKKADIQINVLNADSDQITFNTVDQTQVKFYRDASDANNDGRVDQVIYEYPAGTRKVLANYISRLKFSTGPAFILRIEVRAAQTIRQKPLSFPLIEQVRLRNE